MAVAPNSHSSQSGDKELNCGKSAWQTESLRMSAPDWQDVTLNLFTDTAPWVLEQQLICIMLHHLQNA